MKRSELASPFTTRQTRLLGGVGLFASGLVIGSVLTCRGLLDLVAAAYGSPREEVLQQLEWYIEPVDGSEAAARLDFESDSDSDTSQ